MNKTTFKCSVCGNERTIGGIERGKIMNGPTNCMGGGLVGVDGKWPARHEQIIMQVVSTVEVAETRKTVDTDNALDGSPDSDRLGGLDGS